MKKICLFIVLLLSHSIIAAEDFDLRAEEITYEWLVDLGKKTGYTDHIPVFQAIFSQMDVRTFLEFGVGFSTKYFLDHCKQVISVEFVTNGCGPDWIKSCMSLYHDIPNWIAMPYFSDYREDPEWAKNAYFGTDEVFKAGSYQCGTHKSYANIDYFYLLELDAFISGLTKQHQIDVAFVDPGIYLRGDLVQLLFDKVPLILAHDTVCRHQYMDVYGYSRIETPDNYEEIFIPTKQGVSVWIRKEERFEKLSQQLKELRLP